MTARKSKEALRDVPVSATVLDEADIKEAPLDPQVAITQKSPNVVWNNFGATQGFYAIRGISSLGAPVNNWDGTVGFSVDGVPTSMLGLSTALVDIDRVEVLRGPQGTLWGANALGGAINVTTHQPDGERDFHVSTEVGSHGYATTEAVAGGNLVPDTLDARVAVKLSNYDGDINSLHTDTLGQRGVEAFRGGLRWRGGATTATLTANYSRDQSNAPFFLLGGGANFPTSGALTAPEQTTFRSGVTLNLEHRFDDAVLTSLTGFQNNRVNSYVDSTDTLVYGRLGIPAAFLVSLPGITNDSEKIYSQEVRLNSRDGATVRWVAGVSAVYSDARRQWTSASNPANEGRQRTTNLGLFGDATVPLSSRWSWSLGARVNYDNTDVDVHNEAGAPGTSGSNHTSQAYPTGRTALSFAWTPKITSYAAVSRGHASRVYSLYGVPVGGQLADAYPAATDWTYEFGTKLALLDNRLQIDASVFHNDVKNGVLTYLDPVSARFLTTYQNYQTRGFEMQGKALLTRGLVVTAGLGYTHAVLTADGFASNRVPNIPSWTANVGVRYALPENLLPVPGRFSVSADYRYVSSRVVDVDNSFALRPYGLVNVALGWSHPAGWLDISVFARNLTDKRYETYGASFNGVPVVSVGQGRVIGVGATAYF
ncbi:TonB-dependent receptor [Pandoraea sp. NPDC090278]|uniref:TonB-dependent receptor n=1 Tax=Pandoraea sp. NPDC090278 TaxID=3364391 RepID=UPI00383B0529